MKPSIVILAFILLACAKPSSYHQEEENCQPFFLFDQVYHFHLKLESDTLTILAEKVDRTIDESEFYELLRSDDPMGLMDTIKISKLEDFGFVKNQIEEVHFPGLMDVFCEKKHKEAAKVNLCIPEFNDILVFKRKGQIIAFAKLCFGCNQSVIVGAEKSTYQFGQNKEFEKLADILSIDLFLRRFN
jgi:hypothetical protein